MKLLESERKELYDLYSLIDSHIPVKSTTNGWTTCECGIKTRMSITKHIAAVLYQNGYRKV